MDLDFIPRNNDLGACVPSSQERVNTAKNLGESQLTQTAKALQVLKHPVTPHLPNSDEVEQTLSQMETEAEQQNEKLLRIHTGLNKERVSRLLDLLR
ncbi:MAG: pseudouridine synthase [Desulfovibrio sp.]|nr:pseudouridine synthase [Desulfovibrio sp.]